MHVADTPRHRNEIQQMLDAKPDVNATDGLEGVRIGTRRPGQDILEEPSGKDNTPTEEIQEAVEAARANQRFSNDMDEKADNNVGSAAMPQPAVRSVFRPNDTTPQFSLYSGQVGEIKVLEEQFPPPLVHERAV